MEQEINNKYTSNIKNQSSMNKYSFKKGLGQIKVDDTEKVRSEIMAALKLNNRISWAFRRDGKIIPRVDEKEAIENIFKKYGVKDIWGA